MPSPAPSVPERQCAACRALRPRTELIRLGRLADGSVVIGSTREAPGRGAYLCRSLACYTQARKYRKLEKALRAGLAPAVWADLEAMIGNISGAEAAE